MQLNNALKQELLKIVSVASVVFLALSGLSSIAAAQDKPGDFVNQLPEIFTAICSAHNAQIQAYGDKLAAFSNHVQKQVDALAALKKKSQAGIKVNPNANVADLDRQLQKVNKMISTTEFSEKFYQALHTAAEKTMNLKLDEINKKQSTASDYKEIEQLLAQVKQVRMEYCTAASPHFIELLMAQRALLKTDIAYIVTADDLSQQMKCKTMGYTYFPELSYETAYIHILDHIKYMQILITFCPGNE